MSASPRAHICHPDPQCALEKPKSSLLVTVNGARSSHAWTTEFWNGISYGILTIRDLVFPLPKVIANGLNICFTMNPTKSCGSPQGLCYGDEGCAYSLFNDAANCCPTETIPLA